MDGLIVSKIIIEFTGNFILESLFKIARKFHREIRKHFQHFFFSKFLVFRFVYFFSVRIRPFCENSKFSIVQFWGNVVSMSDFFTIQTPELKWRDVLGSRRFYFEIVSVF